MGGGVLMAIVDKLTRRQCMVVEQILTHQTGLLRSEIAERIGRDEKTVERILKSLPKWVLLKKRDRSLNGAPFRYRARLRPASYPAFAKKLQALHHKPSQAPSQAKG